MNTRQRVQLKRQARRYQFIEKWVIVPGLILLMMILSGWVER